MIVKRLYYTCNMHLTYPAVLKVEARCFGALLLWGIRSVWDSDLASLVAGRSELELLSKNPPHNPNYASRLSRIEIMAGKEDASAELSLTSN